MTKRGFPGGTSSKVSACQGGRHKRCEFNSWVGKIPWGRKWQLTPVFLPGQSHGQRSLVDYCPRGHRRIRRDWAFGHVHTHTHAHTHTFFNLLGHLILLRTHLASCIITLTLERRKLQLWRGLSQHTQAGRCGPGAQSWTSGSLSLLCFCQHARKESWAPWLHVFQL